ncbi:hypothetical protein AYI68_g7186 [Smittium mucronatum]|uniref:Uncharacterized protein n=1 Tax=Smittium mucronatum TaxID=133383 RepID=A0A1R0GPD6_9FUNG|nr:hypothetical protein AYI68_g7186 [Smittium mucronatum]
MVMRNHDLFEYESEASVSSSSEVFALGDDLEPLVNLAGEAVMEYLTSSLIGLLLSVDPKPPVRFSHIIPTAGAVQTLSVVITWSKRQSVDMRSKGVILALRSLLGECDMCTSNSVINVASSFAAQQQFRFKDL